MPKYTQEKNDSIWQTYQKTKDYVKTAGSEDVDPRTVKKVVRVRKLNLAAEANANSEGGKQRELSKDDRLDLDLRRQLEANKLFEKDFPILHVSRDLKLSPQDVIRYRNEFNQMLLADRDPEIERRKQSRANLDKDIDERQNTLEELNLNISSSKQSVAIYQSKKDELIEEIEKKNDIIQDLKDSEKKWRLKE